jgi:8-hydroxy-5-deazaflavin:NADPH oxidoreductase
VNGQAAYSGAIRNPQEFIMQIGILGSGTVAQTLGAGLAQRGHQLMLGTSSPAKLAAWAASVPGVQVGSFAEAAAFGELLTLAVKGHAALQVLHSAGAAALAGKAVLDATNPIAEAPPVDGVLRYFTGPNESLMEQLQAAFPQAHLVKAFNSVGTPRMVAPLFAGGPPTMFIAGNDAAAKQQAAGLVRELGWEVADMGSAVAARAIEPLAMLWCIPGLARNQWTHAFKLLQS